MGFGGDGTVWGLWRRTEKVEVRGWPSRPYLRGPNLPTRDNRTARRGSDGGVVERNSSLHGHTPPPSPRSRKSTPNPQGTTLSFLPRGSLLWSPSPEVEVVLHIRNEVARDLSPQMDRPETDTRLRLQDGAHGGPGPCLVRTVSAFAEVTPVSVEGRGAGRRGALESSGGGPRPTVGPGRGKTPGPTSTSPDGSGPMLGTEVPAVPPQSGPVSPTRLMTHDVPFPPTRVTGDETGRARRLQVGHGP